MTHCPVCGRPGPGLCSECRAQIISLRPDDKRYFWYVRAIRAFYLDRMNCIYCCQSKRLR